MKGNYFGGEEEWQLWVTLLSEWNDPSMWITRAKRKHRCRRTSLSLNPYKRTSFLNTGTVPVPGRYRQAAKKKMWRIFSQSAAWTYFRENTSQQAKHICKQRRYKIKYWKRNTALTLVLSFTGQTPPARQLQHQKLKLQKEHHSCHFIFNLQIHGGSGEVIRLFLI